MSFHQAIDPLAHLNSLHSEQFVVIKFTTFLMNSTSQSTEDKDGA
jgi:hypothetical protein